MATRAVEEKGPERPPCLLVRLVLFPLSVLPILGTGSRGSGRVFTRAVVIHGVSCEQGISDIRRSCG